MLDHDKAMKLWEWNYEKKTQAYDIRNRLIIKRRMDKKVLNLAEKFTIYDLKIKVALMPLRIFRSFMS